MAIFTFRVGIQCANDYIDLPKLNTLRVGEYSFQKTNRLNLSSTVCFLSVHSDLPSLVEFTCDSYAFFHTDLASVSGSVDAGVSF